MRQDALPCMVTFVATRVRYLCGRAGTRSISCGSFEPDRLPVSRRCNCLRDSTSPSNYLRPNVAAAFSSISAGKRSVLSGAMRLSRGTIINPAFTETRSVTVRPLCMNSANGYVSGVEAALVPLADAQRAAAMAAYMKNHFVFLGIATPGRRTAIKPLPKPDAADVHDIVRTLWTRTAREYHYVALDLLDSMATKIDPRTTIALIEELTQTNSWWDSVDGFAGIASGILRRNTELRDIVWHWSSHPSFWVNRLAILHQNGWKNETDSCILFKLCLAHAGSEEFFIRKAIGWALRDYAWVNKAAVQNFVQENRACLSKLSIREALKNVGSPEA